LRGRVGARTIARSRISSCREGRVLTEDAEKRLKVIESFDELGAGFKIALKDMEIRGAGNLLGPEQSGFILGLGFDLYVRCSRRRSPTSRACRRKSASSRACTTDWAAFLPDDYVPDNEEKLELYRRLAVASRPD
jgi:transcription-repair coupling factor (superfamily II helicase)